MTKPEWVTMATYNTLEDAKKLRDYLEVRGLDVNVHDERRLQRFWFLARPLAGIHVQVDKQFVETAESFFEGSGEIALRAVRCPACQSSRVQYPAMTRENLLPTVVGHILSVLCLTTPEYYCQRCHHTWVKPGHPRHPDKKSR